MFHLIDTFNGRTVSRHRTLVAAHAADRRLQKSLHKSSPGSYLPTKIAVDDPEGEGVRIGVNRYYGIGTLRPVSEEEWLAHLGPYGLGP